ncbi:hypothetical protein AB833_06650 [Chromatiales bacterium (ex Bugula neritina AB1)]|nr:hypothetical protein AB833_06650 [Chromatiales bacterium (ex Bugula neritina AB1)]
MTFFTFLVLVSCATFPISTAENVCSVFKANTGWHKTAVKMQDKWDLPFHVPMAIMYQESKFRRKAKPPRRYLLGFIPWKRRSTAYGYAQAVNGTWRNYIDETDSPGARRTNFKDALDFMGWYMNKSSKINRISKDDTYNQYLAYHEGWTGYKRKSYEKKKWLKRVASEVDAMALRYKTQYSGCAKELNQGFWQRLFR